jgi:geranylgeranyl pyrophosphate synthase
VLQRAETFARANAPGAAAWRLLEPAFRDAARLTKRRQITTDGLFCVWLPRVVYVAITGDEGPAIELLVPLYLLHLGTELMDDVTDGDLGPAWCGIRPDEVAMAAAALAATLAPLALTELPVPPATILALQRTLARGLLTMFGGQAIDTALTNSRTATAELVERSIVGKSGGAVAMYATLAAQFAGAPREVVDVYADLGRCLGTLAQIRSEVLDLVISHNSRDLSAGTRTLPVAIGLDRLTGEARDGFLSLLNEARMSPNARLAVRDRLMELGVADACSDVSARYAQLARVALEESNVGGPAITALRRMIDHASSLSYRARSGGPNGTANAPIHSWI